MEFLKINFKVVLIVIFALNITSEVNGYENKILFKVNNEIITSIDLIHEIEYRKLLNKRLENLPVEKLFQIAKNSLIQEKIKKIHMSKFYVEAEIDKKNLNLLLNDFIKKTNFQSKDQMLKYLELKNIRIDTFIEKIKTQILWNQLIISKFSQNLKVDKNKIRSNILQNNKQKNYFLYEIVFNLENENLKQKYNKIKQEIYLNGFENAASVYSISDSSKEGGKIGWVSFNSLSKNIKEEILLTKKKQITNPILIPGGFLILKIQDEKNIDIIENIDQEVENISKSMVNKQLNQFSNIYFNKIKKEINVNEL